MNFGHTIGHGFESLKMKKIDKLLHGEAIAAGMIIELYLSHMILGFPKKIVDDCNKHLGKFFKKIKVNDSELDKLFRLIKSDKKNFKNDINFVLLVNIGEIKIDQNIDQDKIKKAINYYLNS